MHNNMNILDIAEPSRLNGKFYLYFTTIKKIIRKKLLSVVLVDYRVKDSMKRPV